MTKVEFAKALVVAWWRDRVQQTDWEHEAAMKLFSVQGAKPQDLVKDIRVMRDMLTDALKDLDTEEA